MQPDISKISIKNNLKQIKDFLTEVILSPRKNMIKWSKITNQTPNLKIGYPGQHLASLITGMQGTATGARGQDIIDGTEVKSCSRVDQLDKCEDCKSNVLRFQNTCEVCGSENIRRQNDSKWLIGIKNEKELDLYLNKIPRILFLISDYPRFPIQDYSIIRFSSYEIWNQSERAYNFRTLLYDYYHEIYLKHIERDAKKQPAPKNFWPYSFQFYMCNPIKTFECVIEKIDTITPSINITHYIEPHVDRGGIPSENLPCFLLNKQEKESLNKSNIDWEKLGSLDEETKKLLKLRNTSKAQPQNQIYHRGEWGIFKEVKD
ncbi:MamI family restriction endonuclease [Akkermansia muciniphila]|uniref:MamI family restriction endonuclease n=2 Tax=Akkermansia TaxID=239934 RepID=UPI0029E81365|nr:MamI family restriction endonuclease [Akkermansia muciniphila]WPK65646.1 MamI family restriction endonuclease [Akkermansia muciniphila]